MTVAPPASAARATASKSRPRELERSVSTCSFKRAASRLRASSIDGFSSFVLLPRCPLPVPPEMFKGTVPVPQARRMTNGPCNIGFRLHHSALYWTATGQESGQGRREGAASTVRVARLYTLRTQFKAALTIKVDIGRLSHTMPTLEHNVTRSQSVQGANCRMHLRQRPNRATKQRGGLRQVRRDNLSQRQ